MINFEIIRKIYNNFYDFIIRDFHIKYNNTENPIFYYILYQKRVKIDLL
jgi:hypothetical protein